MIKCIDLFCGVGGLSHGLMKEGIDILAGFDIDEKCRFAYEKNNDAVFFNQDISTVTGKDLNKIFGKNGIKLLAGCAPCQPFSTYSYRYGIDKSEKWALLYQFSRLIDEAAPDIIAMENVSSVVKHVVFTDFVEHVQKLGYKTWFGIIDCSQYGVPQSRKRLVFLASRFGEISFVKPTQKTPITVRQAIGKLPKIGAGESYKRDKLHVAASLSELNIQRIRNSKPGGSWKDWPECLIADCHKQKSGKTFPSVYGRMEWDKPAPTMTTQCYGYGNGRFGHPEQDRAISLREAAILQSFPKTYQFLEKAGEIGMTDLGRMIGNAVPVSLGRAIGKSIKTHIENKEI